MLDNAVKVAKRLRGAAQRHADHRRCRPRASRQHHRHLRRRRGPASACATSSASTTRRGSPTIRRRPPTAIRASIDVTRRLAFVFAGFPDHCASGKPYLGGPFRPAESKENKAVANEVFCTPEATRMQGNLPFTQPQGRACRRRRGADRHGAGSGTVQRAPRQYPRLPCDRHCPRSCQQRLSGVLDLAAVGPVQRRHLLPMGSKAVWTTFRSEPLIGPTNSALLRPAGSIPWTSSCAMPACIGSESGSDRHRHRRGPHRRDRARARRRRARHRPRRPAGHAGLHRDPHPSRQVLHPRPLQGREGRPRGGDRRGRQGEEGVHARGRLRARASARWRSASSTARRTCARSSRSIPASACAGSKACCR